MGVFGGRDGEERMLREHSKMAPRQWSLPLHPSKNRFAHAPGLAPAKLNETSLCVDGEI